MAIDLDGLIKELQAAGIAFSVVNEQGIVWDLTYNQIQSRPDVAAVVAAHNKAIWDAYNQRCNVREASAKATADGIPNWATWTQDEFATWCTNNLMTDAQVDGTTLSTALKTNIKALNAFTRNSGKLLIAFRDRTWPDLPEA